MEESRKISKAIIPVAGLGTRMLPATKAVPRTFTHLRQAFDTTYY